MICPSCGGEYADWAHRCPYCGTVNEQVDEQVYLAHLESLRKRLDVVDEESEASYRKGITETGNRLMKRVLIIGVIIAALVALGLGISAYNQKRREEQELQQLKWEREEFPKLDSWYEAGEYDRIIEEYYSLILDKKNTFSMFGWPHYNYVCDFYQRNREIQDVMADMDAGNTPDGFYLGQALYDALLFQYENTDDYLDRLMNSYRTNGRYGITEEEAESVRQMRETAATFLREYIRWEDAESEAFYRSVSTKGYIRMDSCIEKGKEMVKEWES